MKKSAAKEPAKPALVPKLRFPEYRGVPGWEQKNLSELFSQREETGYADLRLLSLTDAEGIIPQEDSGRKSSASVDKSKYLRVVPGDIAYNTMRMWEGRSARVTLEGLVSPAYTVCKPNDGTDSLFFSYYFKTQQLIDQFVRYSQGLVKDTLNLKFEAFSRIVTATARPPEQHKIASCLITLDNLIAAESRKLEALKNHKKGLMQQLFPREGETQPRLRFPEFWNDGEWRKKTLEAIAPLQRGFDLPSQDIRAGQVPIVYSNGPKGFHAKGMAVGPGLVTGRSGTIGKLHFIESGAYWPHNTSLWVTSFKGHVPKFVYYLFDSIGFLRFASGSGVPTLNRNDAHSFKTSVPPTLAEQHRIASCLSSLDAVITAETQKIEALKIHKKGLMQQLFPSLEEAGA